MSIVLTGDLAFLGLGEVLQTIGSNGGSGVLRIMSKYIPDPGFIYFIKGNVVNAKTPSESGLDAAYALFGWTEGQFEFTEEAVTMKKVINANRMEIILDGLRMVDDGEIKKLGAVSFDSGESQGEEKKGQSVPVIKGPLVDYMYVVEEEEFRAGQKIVQENSYGNWVWVIMEGVVDIIKETPQGPISILKLGEGAYIGNLSSFSFANTIRSASAHAVTDVILGILDSQRLSREFNNMSHEMKAIAMSLENRRTYVTDRAIEIYQKQDTLKEFMKDKKPAIKQGSTDEKAFLITQGDAVIVRKIKEGFVPLIHLQVSDVFGQVPFLDPGHEPHSASVLVSSDLQGKAINIEALQKEYDKLSSTMRNMLENITTSISVTTRLACEFYRKNIKKK